MLESQIDQIERNRVLDNDRKVREGGTFHAFAEADAATPLGRFSAIANAQVVGATAAPSYPACSPALSVQLPDEPPLGFDNPALEPPTLSPSAVQAGEPIPGERAPLRMPGERAARGVGSPLSQDDPDPRHFPPGPARIPRDPGRRPQFRRRV